MESQSYKFKANRKTVIATVVHFVVLIAAGLLIWWMYVGGYFSAWFTTLMVALAALMVLSMPRKVVVSKSNVTIFCIWEIVDIPIEEITSVRKVDNSECRWMLPIFGSCGFFGYYGYYINIDTFERVRFYATEWQNLVEIVDIYDDRYYISCRQADEFIANIERNADEKQSLN